MAHVFRLQKKHGKNDIKDWERTQRYNSNMIDDIVDSNEEKSANKPITSIPSPFAQFNLVQTAFEYVSYKDEKGNYPNLEKLTAYNKIVSNALDVAQIFFEWDRMKELFEIIEWNRDMHLSELIDEDENNEPGHKQLGETYKLFFERDNKQNNFEHFSQMYMLHYRLGNNPLNIVGSISPTTLFMATPNDLSNISDKILFANNDRPFDDAYYPLYKRDKHFHQWLWNIKNNMFKTDAGTNKFPTLFKALDKYLDACFTKSDNERKNILRAAVPEGTFTPLYFGEGNAHQVNILGVNLCVKQKYVPNTKACDFVIHSEINQSTILALQPGFAKNNWQYLNGEYKPNEVTVPYYDPKPLEERTLPGDNTKHPYLTTSDFLSDTLIQLPASTDSKNFFAANLNDKDHTYLLPIKDIFFDYFTALDLMTRKVNGKPMCEINKKTAAIQVTLRIPVKRNNGQECIEYVRNYYTSNEIDTTHKNGRLVALEDDQMPSLALMPNVQNAGIYHVGLISSTAKLFEIHFYQGNATVSTKENGTRNEITDSIMHKAYLLTQNFDRIKLTDNCGNEGVIIPTMPRRAGNDSYTFAIDFGTTNTHIEYVKENSKTIEPFTIKDEEKQLVYLTNMSDNLTHQNIFDSDLMPTLITDSGMFHFPMRTSLVAGNKTNWDTARTVVDANVNFIYEKRNKRGCNKEYTNLKWSTDSHNQRQIECYIDHLFLLIRNKVLLNGGNLSTTKVVWSYPNSMTPSRRNKLNKIFKDAFNKYIGETPEYLSNISESIAPYIYIKQSHSAINRIVTIDIGGGTTDAVFVEDNQILGVTSFKFAADAIFGDGYTTLGTNNGLVEYFSGEIIKKVKDKGAIEEIYNAISGSGSSKDIASFLFSLVQHNEIPDNAKKSVDFNSILNFDDKYKFVFVVFYAALIYHVAQLMKEHNMDAPRHIAFSGNGSKVISILTDNNKLLTNFTRYIFAKVYGNVDCAKKLEIIYEPNANPKANTAKGACSRNTLQNNEASIQNIIPLNLRNTDTKYKDVNDQYLDEHILPSVKEFMDFVFNDLVDGFEIRKNFGVDPDSINSAKNVAYNDWLTYAKNGVQLKLDDGAEDDSIDETMFFYPIFGVINAIINEIRKG